MDEHLSRLGLTSNATREDIQKAFKKLALQFHPDKYKGDIDVFLKIKESYDILINNLCDQKEGTHQQDQGRELFNEVIDILISSLRKHISKNTNNIKNETIDDLQINLKVTLEDIYYGRVKKIVVRCRKWENGFVNETLLVPLTNYQAEYTFIGKGDYISEDIRKNILVKLDIEEHDLLKIDTIVSQFDLYIEYKLSLYEYYCRKLLIFNIFNKNIEFHLIEGKKCYLIKDQGLPYYNEYNEVQRGKLYLFLDVELKYFGDNLPTTLQETLLQYFSD